MAEEITKVIENVDELFPEIIVNGESHVSERYVEPPQASIPASTPQIQETESTYPQQTVQGEYVDTLNLNGVEHDLKDSPLSAEVSALQTLLSTIQSRLNELNALIPSTATSQNQLADKNFVNSSIATNTANFLGTYTSLADIEAIQNPTNNDYAFLETADGAGNNVYDRYKYSAEDGEWLFEYELNNSSFTAEQWATINSGITQVSDTVQDGDTNPVSSDAVYEALQNAGGGGGAQCDTAGNVQAKVATMDGFVLNTGVTFPITFANANSYDGKITLNVNSTGAKDVYINNAVSSSTNKTLNAGSYICWYDGTNYYIDTGYAVTQARNAGLATIAGAVSIGSVISDLNDFLEENVTYARCTNDRTSNMPSGEVSGTVSVSSTGSYVSSGTYYATYEQIFEGATGSIYQRRGRFRVPQMSVSWQAWEKILTEAYAFNSLHIAKDGSIYADGTMANYPIIKMKDNTSDVNGNGIVIGGGGATVIGGGESADTYYSGAGLSAGTETMVVANDGAITFVSNLQSNYASRKEMTMGTDGKLSNPQGFVGNVTGNCSGSSGSCTGNAVTATTASSCSGNSATATKVVGTYTGNGGQQNPRYVGKERVCFNMMNTSINGNSQYKDFMMSDCYSGFDVGGTTAIGVCRQSMRVFAMRADAGTSPNRPTSWAESCEINTTVRTQIPIGGTHTTNGEIWGS